MTIYGIGTDILDIRRIEKISQKKYFDRFINRILSIGEISLYKKLSTESEKSIFLAKRYSAKEAYLKALGTGYRLGLAFNKINFTYDELGKPNVELLDKNFLIIDRLIGRKFANFISWSDEYPYILSFAVITLI